LVGPDGTIYLLATLGEVRWQHRLDGIPQDTPTEGPGHDYLYALKLDGTQKWRFALGGSKTAWALKIGPSGTVYVADNHELYAIDSKGACKWELPYPGESGWLDFGPDGTIYLAGGARLPKPSRHFELLFDASGPLGPEGVLFALNSDGTQKWKTGAQGTHVVGPDGTLYLTAGNLLQAINPEGRRRWSLALGEVFVRALCCPQLKSGNAWAIYAVGNDNLCAVAPNGTQKWKFPFAGQLVESLDIGPDGTIYFPANTANGHGRVYALRTDGTQKWKFGGRGWIDTVWARSKGAIYVEGEGPGSPDWMDPGELYALESDGTLAWELPCREDSRQCRVARGNFDGTWDWQEPWQAGLHALGVLALGPDDSLYVKEDYAQMGIGSVVAVGPDGEAKWDFGYGEFSLAFGADGTIYVAENKPAACVDCVRGSALDALTPAGDQKWAFSPGVKIGGPAVNTPRQ
jgi:hypothetical protein